MEDDKIKEGFVKLICIGDIIPILDGDKKVITKFRVDVLTDEYIKFHQYVVSKSKLEYDCQFGLYVKFSDVPTLVLKYINYLSQGIQISDPTKTIILQTP